MANLYIKVCATHSIEFKTQNNKDMNIFIPDETKIDEEMKHFFEFYLTRTPNDREYQALI